VQDVADGLLLLWRGLGDFVLEQPDLFLDEALWVLLNMKDGFLSTNKFLILGWALL
jgi:hypothetical protein